MFDDVVYVSTTASDLSDRGGFVTNDYSVLFRLDSNWENHLIVAGGEALCVRWFPILSYVVPWVSFLQLLSGKISKLPFGKIFLDFCSLLVERVYNTKTYFVFSVGKNELPQFKTIAYNALGGSWLSNSDILDKPKVKEILSSVDFFTVRDKKTSIALSERGIRHSICPDTAIMMSDVFSEETLLNRLSVSKDIAATNYIFFQGNLGLWKNQYRLAAKQLADIAIGTSCKICLCPIGTALGHSDQIALKHIANLMEKNYFYIVKPNIFDIMWLIKHSKMYIGSSLHGTITAMSFGVPYIGYGANKLKAYIEEWGETDRFVNKEQIANAIIQYNYNYDYISDRQKVIVMDSFELLKSLYAD